MAHYGYLGEENIRDTPESRDRELKRLENNVYYQQNKQYFKDYWIRNKARKMSMITPEERRRRSERSSRHWANMPTAERKVYNTKRRWRSRLINEGLKY